MSPTMQYVFNVALLYCTDYVRIIEQVRIIIVIFVTLDHVHFENEILFYIACGCMPVLAAHHRCPYVISTS